LAGAGSISATTGRLTSSSATFTSGGSANPARIDGLVHGAGGEAVSGVYSTTASGSAGIAGAFVGSGLQEVKSLQGFADGSGIGEGQIGLLGRAESSSVFIAQDFNTIAYEANSASDARRNAALIASLGAELTGASRAADGVDIRSGNFTYLGQSIAATSYASWNAIGQLVVVDASARPATSSLLVAGGTAPTSIPVSGAYTWEGVQLWSQRDQLGDTSSGTFRITTTFGNAGNAFTYATTGASPAVTLAGSGTLDPSSGKLKATGLTFTPSSGASGIAARLDGSLLGAGAQALSGIFATTAATGTKYAGGFVGAGPIVADTIAEFGTDLGLGVASLSVAGAAESPLVFLADDIDAIRKETNNASNSTRASALLANINPTSFTNSGNVASGNGVTRETGATLAYASDTLGVVRYADRRGLAKILFLDEDDHASADSLIIATGSKLEGDAPTGGYTWQGVHAWTTRGDIGAVSAANEAAFTLTADFSNSSFAFTSTGRLTGAGSISPTTGRLSSTSASFTNGGVGQTARIEGLLHGEGGEAVSGLYSTIAGGTDGFTGAFVGSGPQEVTSSVRLADGSGLGAGNYSLAGAARAGLVFVAENLDAIMHEANSASDVTRSGALLASLGPGFSGAPTQANGINSRSGNFIYKGANLAGTSHVSLNQAARLVVIDASAHPSASSIIIAGGTAASALPTVGSYRWEGVHLWGQRDELDSLSTGTFQITATFETSGGAFTYATTGDSPAITLAGSGSIDAASGSLTGSARGAGAQGVSGAFVTRATGGIQYAGGFLGGGPQVAREIARFGTEIGIGEARLGVAGGATAPLIFVADDYDAIIDEANSASDAIRASALLANVNPSTFTTIADIASGNGVKRGTGATIAYDSGTLGVTRYTDGRGLAQILFLDASGVASADSLILASGDQLSGAAPTGGYTWQGVHAWSDRGDIGDVSVANEAGFTLTADFSNSSFAFASTGRLTGSGSISAATGRLTSSSATFTNGGAGQAARIEGLLHGAGAEAVSGIYSTTGGANTGIAGAFIGSGPQEVTSTQRFADGSGVGEGRYGLLGGDKSSLVFLAQNFNVIAQEANSASNNIRNAALLASIDSELTGARSQNNGVISRGGNFTYGGANIAGSSHVSWNEIGQLVVGWCASVGSA